MSLHVQFTKLEICVRCTNVDATYEWLRKNDIMRGLRFLSVNYSFGECVPGQVIYVLSGLILWQVLDMFKTSNGRHRIKMLGG